MFFLLTNHHTGKQPEFPPANFPKNQKIFFYFRLSENYERKEYLNRISDYEGAGLDAYLIEMIKDYNEQTTMYTDMAEGSYFKPECGTAFRYYCERILRKHHTWQVKGSTIIIEDELVTDYRHALRQLIKI